MDAETLTRALGGRWHGRYGLASCPVPGHGKGRGDRNPSLSISRGDRQAIVVYCHAGCGQSEVIESLKNLGFWDSAEPASTFVPIRRASHGPDPRIRAANELWSKAIPVQATPAASYLCNRHLPAESEALRYLPAASYAKIPATADGAMVSALRSRGGEVRAVQLTYITEGGRKARANPVRQTFGAMAGTGVQLTPAGTTLGLAEGVETALSASLLFDVPVWAACGGRLEDVPIPDRARKVVLFADNDGPGRVAAERALHVLGARGFDVFVRTPEAEGQDWNDVLFDRVQRT